MHRDTNSLSDARSAAITAIHDHEVLLDAAIISVATKITAAPTHVEMPATSPKNAKAAMATNGSRRKSMGAWN